MKVKTTKITLPNKDYDEKLSKLEKNTGYQRLDILDEPASNTFKINVPIFLRGESVKFNLPCVIQVKKKPYTIEFTVYSDTTIPLIVTLTFIFLIAFVSFKVYDSIGISITLVIFGTILIVGTFINQIKKQTRKRVREWFW